MDLSRAKRIGELAHEIEALELSLIHAKSAQTNRAFILRIVATDEAICERSIDFGLPPQPNAGVWPFLADLQTPPENMSSEQQKVRAMRELEIANSARVFKLVEQIIAEKLEAKRKEMEGV